MPRGALIALVLLATACHKDSPPRSGRPDPIGSSERKRGDDACRAYIDRLCACAKAKPDDKDLADRCEIKHAKLEALELALSVDDDPAAGAQDVFQAQDQARKIIAKCIEENVKLDQECP